MANEIGDLIAKFVLGLNDSIDKRMGVTTFKEKEEDFVELAHIAGEIVEDKVTMTSERLLMLKAASLYASTYVQARGEAPIKQLPEPSEEE